MMIGPGTGVQALGGPRCRIRVTRPASHLIAHTPRHFRWPSPRRAIRPGPGRIAGATRWTPEITLPGPKSRDTLDDHVGEGHRHATIRAALAAPGTAAACTLSPGRPHEDALRLHHVGPRRPTPVPLDAPPDPRRIRNLSSRIITPRRLKRIRPSPFDVEDLDATTCVPPAPV